MPFCSNCGNFVAEGKKYCSKCGSSMEETLEESSTHRKQEYVGRINKCPACGAEITSFMAFCPDCGHELNSVEVAASIKDFSSKINAVDIEIANTPVEEKKGWKTWRFSKKFFWVCLNIYTFCIPIFIRFLLPLLGISLKSSLTPAEKKKLQIINNFTFPNDRESILEALLFIKTQISSIATATVSSNSYYWAKIWKNKADQLYERAEFMFKGDLIATNTYSEILKSEKIIKKGYMIKVVIAAVAIAIAMAFLIGKFITPAIKENNKTLEWPEEGISLQIPVPESKKGEVKSNDDKRFRADVRRIDEKEFHDYVNSCEDKGFNIEIEKQDHSFEAFNSEGYKLDLYYFSSDSEMSITLESPEEMGEIQWPDNDISKQIPSPNSTYGRIEALSTTRLLAYVGKITKDEYKQYVNQCIEAGFDIDYERSDDMFSGLDADGYMLRIDYKGFNTICIQIEKE